MTTQPMAELVAGIVPADFKPKPIDFGEVTRNHLAEAFLRTVGKWEEGK